MLIPWGGRAPTLARVHAHTAGSPRRKVDRQMAARAQSSVKNFTPVARTVSEQKPAKGN